MLPFLKSTLASYEHAQKDLDGYKQAVLDECDEIRSTLIPIWKKYQLIAIGIEHDGFTFVLNDETFDITKKGTAGMLTMAHLEVFENHIANFLQKLIEQMKIEMK